MSTSMFSEEWNEEGKRRKRTGNVVDARVDNDPQTVALVLVLGNLGGGVLGRHGGGCVVRMYLCTVMEGQKPSRMWPDGGNECEN